jgi:hypothetical protein
MIFQTYNSKTVIKKNNELTFDNEYVELKFAPKSKDNNKINKTRTIKKNSTPQKNKAYFFNL